MPVEVPTLCRVAKSSSIALSCGLLFANRPRVLAAGANRDVVVHGELREDLLPEVRQVFVNDGERNQAGVEHLEQILVLQRLGASLSITGGFFSVANFSLSATRLS